MPKQKSFIIKIKGFIKGVSYYFENGEPRQRIPNPPTKDQIYNDPRFAGVRANNKEFGGASTYSKSIATGLKNNIHTFKDSRCTSRLTAALQKIIKKGRGTPGKREANILNGPENLMGFQLQKNNVFNQIFTAKYIVSVNEKRTKITIKIPNITLYNLKNNPSSATHFILTAALSIVSIHNWNSKIKKYEPDYPKVNGLGDTKKSEPLLCKIEHQNISIQLINPAKTTISGGVAITVWLGISFGKETDNKFVPFETAKAMECIAIF